MYNHLSVSQLTLTNFRNHKDFRLDLDQSPVVITGSNGAGKTNILEALSLLVPGRGLSRASSSDWQNYNDANPWGVSSVLKSSEIETRISTGKDPLNNKNERRIICIDGKKIKNQQELTSHIVMSWVTPDMDRVLVNAPSSRRRLIDRMVYSFDPAHSGRVHRYEKTMRERLKILRDGISDDSWLSSLEIEMARTSVSIAAARMNMLSQLQNGIEDTEGIFPKAKLSLHGIAEDSLKEYPALIVEDKICDALKKSRNIDAQNGTSSVGVHRTDLKVIHLGQNCLAHLCSTGEQKSLLIAIMIAYVRVLMCFRKITPIFLLDDITSHLDNIRREALFEELLSLKIQSWLTGTDKSSFKELLSSAQHFHL